MAENTAIEWADHTFNPWLGCTKVSPACDHCYAEARMDTRLHVVQWGAGQPRKRTSEANWRLPLKWNREAEAFQAKHGRRQRVFCASLADVFDNEVPRQWRMDLFSLIGQTPHLDWLLLTKRIGNVMTMCSYDGLMFDLIGESVWLGATICNQAEAARDIPKLLAVPAAKRFLSIEPMLGPVDLNNITVAKLDHDTVIRSVDALTGMGTESGISPREHVYTRREQVYERGIDWVICGGESGPKARPMHPDWVRSLRDQCKAAGVPFFFKQWGEWSPIHRGDEDHLLDDTYIRLNGTTHTTLRDDHAPYEVTDELIHRIGKKAAGRLLDGREWSEVPA